MMQTTSTNNFNHRGRIIKATDVQTDALDARQAIEALKGSTEAAGLNNPKTDQNS